MNIVLDVLRYLNEHDITLVKAAEATGVAQQNIKKSIGNNPKTSTLLALAKGLGVDPREFFYDLDEEKKKEHTNSTILDESDSWGASDAAEEKKQTQRGKRKNKMPIQQIRKFSASTIPLFRFQMHSLQLTPPPSALIVAQRFASVWCPARRMKILRQALCAYRGKC